jgi:putative endonuclease
LINPIEWTNVHLSGRTKTVRTARQHTGQKGEVLALQFLAAQGYSIWDKNVRLGRDEIDIIAFDPHDGVLVFTEVKTRRSVSIHYAPELNLTYKKRAHMRRSAERWITTKNYDGPWRMDTICVVASKVTNHVLGVGSL